MSAVAARVHDAGRRLSAPWRRGAAYQGSLTDGDSCPPAPSFLAAFEVIAPLVRG